MKNILATIGVIATLLFTSYSVVGLAGNKSDGDGHHRGEKREARMLEKLSAKLELSAEQKVEVTALVQQAKPLMKKARESRISMRQEMMKFDNIGADYDTRMIQLADEQAENTRQFILEMSQLKLRFSQILTPEQLTRATALEHVFGGKRGGRKHRRGHHDETSSTDQTVTE